MLFFCGKVFYLFRVIRDAHRKVQLFCTNLKRECANFQASNCEESKNHLYPSALVHFPKHFCHEARFWKRVRRHFQIIPAGSRRYLGAYVSSWRTTVETFSKPRGIPGTKYSGGVDYATRLWQVRKGS